MSHRQQQWKSLGALPPLVGLCNLARNDSCPGLTLTADASKSDALMLQCAAFDSWIESTPCIDAFCSSSTWGMPATSAFGPRDETEVWTFDEGAAAFARYGNFLRPLECIWLLGTPIVGPKPHVVLRELFRNERFLNRDWRILVLAGLPLGTPEWHPFVELCQRLGRLDQLGDPRCRNIASLDGGVDGWMSRRTGKFRTGLRHSEKVAREYGVSFQRRLITTAAEADRIFPLIEQVEQRSHKLIGGNSILNEPMRSFVSGVFHLSAARHSVRFIEAWADDQVVGYIFGTVYQDMYRGLQMSFDDIYRPLALGNLLQLNMIHWLTEDRVHQYDMGAELPYKERWAELKHETRTLLLRRR
jgi:hypothetical protein